MLALGRHHRAVVVVACPCVNIVRPIHTALTSAELCALLELHVLISISSVFNTTLWCRIAIMYAKGDKNRTAGHFWCYWSEHVRYQSDNRHSIFYCKATLTCLIGPQQGKCNCMCLAIEIMVEGSPAISPSAPVKARETARPPWKDERKLKTLKGWWHWFYNGFRTVVKESCHLIGHIYFHF